MSSKSIRQQIHIFWFAIPSVLSSSVCLCIGYGLVVCLCASSPVINFVINVFISMIHTHNYYGHSGVEHLRKINIGSEATTHYSDFFLTSTCLTEWTLHQWLQHLKPFLFICSSSYQNQTVTSSCPLNIILDLLVPSLPCQCYILFHLNTISSAKQSEYFKRSSGANAISKNWEKVNNIYSILFFFIPFICSLFPPYELYPFVLLCFALGRKNFVLFVTITIAKLPFEYPKC